jgi:hypothetical protein
MDANVAVCTVLVPRIRHIVPCGRIWIASTVEAEIARAVMTFQTECEHDRTF